MPASADQPVRLSFESFDLDLRTRELRKDGRLVKLQDQPFRLLALLASRPGTLVTRPEIEKELWGEDTVVEFEHSINTAMRKIREALGDDLEKPRFVETLPRKGYRFIAPVRAAGASGEVRTSPADASPSAASLRERIPLRTQPLPPEEATARKSNASESATSTPPADPAPSQPLVQPAPATRAHAVRADDFALPRGAARPLFLLIQAGFLAMYCAALYKAEAIEGVLARLSTSSTAILSPAILVLAMCGIAVRLYLLSAVGLDHPDSGIRFRQLFPALFTLDVLWSASPLLLAPQIGYGLALGSVAALAYLPFAQRTLMSSAYRGSKRTAPASSGASFLAPALLLVLPFFPTCDGHAAELQPRTLESWETYVRLTEQRVERELDGGRDAVPRFLATDFLSASDPQQARAVLRNGRVPIQRMQTTDANGKPIAVPDGMIHHWIGGIYVPGVTLESLLAWLQDYDQHERFFVEVEDARLLSRDGPEFRIFYRLRRKKVITVFYNTLHTVVYRRHDPYRASSRSFTTRIAELDSPGEAAESEKPVGNDRGFLWRLNSYWRFLETDGGVFVECESISLSRSIPFGLSWLIKGYVESIPRESLENTLTSIRDGIAMRTGALQSAREN